MENNIKTIDRKGICASGDYVDCKNFFSEKPNTIQKTVKNIPICKKIESLSDYFNLLKELHDENEKRLKDEGKKCGSLFFYRGQCNVDYTYTPSILRRNDDISREHLLFREFHRRFYEVFDIFQTTFEQEVFMQHYGVGSRCLDLIENPLIALWAACYHEKEDSSTNCGEVSFWCIDNDSNDLKAYDSSTASILCSIAKMEKCFSLGHVEIEYHKEHPTALEDFIYLKDVLRCSTIIRPKYNNKRIKNQQGAFAIVNLTKMYGDGFEEKFGISIEKFSDYILNAEELNKGKGEEYQKPNIARLREGKHTLGVDFSELSSWDLWFEKIAVDESPVVDSYDLYKYMYKTDVEKDSRKIRYAIIPYEAKKDILKELKYLNITRAFIYPDIEDVAKELKENYCLEGN